MMGSRDNICREKLDIQNGLPEDGSLLLNGDNDMIRKHLSYVKKPYEFYGFAPDCAYRAENIREENGQTHFTFCYNSQREDMVLNVLGEHNVSNALAAIAIGLKYDVPMDAVKQQLSTFSGQRQNIINTNGYLRSCLISMQTGAGSPFFLICWNWGLTLLPTTKRSDVLSHPPT